MQWVSGWLARGIVIGAVLFTGGDLSDLPASRPSRALQFVRSQDFTPIFDLAGRRVGDYFAREREERFMEALFSLSGKWKAVTRGRASYERFVRKSFEEHLFNPAEFERVLEQIRADYAFGIAAAENRLLALLYDDLRPLRPGLQIAEIRRDYERLAADLAPHVLKDLGMNLIAFAGSEAASVLLVAALTSAGILGGSAAAGAAGGPWSFGISLIAGIAAGVAIDSVVGEAQEDAARMEVRCALNSLRNRIIDAVHDALVRALSAYLILQMRCVQAMCEGETHERMAARP